MVVEDRLVAALAGGLGGARDVVGERAPAARRRAAARLLAAAAGVRDPLGPAGVAQHGPRAGRAGGVEQVERVVQRRRMSSSKRSASENRMGTKPPTTSRPLASSRSRSDVALAEVAGRAEVGAGVAAAPIASSTRSGSGTAKSVPTVISKAP